MGTGNTACHFACTPVVRRHRQLSARPSSDPLNAYRTFISLGRARNASLPLVDAASRRRSPESPCASAFFSQYLRVSRAHSTPAKRLPLDICSGDAIACFSTFIQTRTRWCDRPSQTHPGMFVTHAAQQWERTMQLPVRGVSGTSTATFFTGNDADVPTPRGVFAHPYGLCTPRRLLGALVAARRTAPRAASSVRLHAVTAVLPAPETAITAPIGFRLPVTPPPGASA
jgi:hypothetical protein